MEIDPSDLERLSGPSDRSSRMQFSGGGSTNSPSVQSQVIAHDVPEFNTGQTGLEGLSRAFDAFYRPAMIGLEAVANAAERRSSFEQQKALKEIEIENARKEKERSNKGAADALAGRARDTGLDAFTSYRESYSAALATRDAPRHWSDFLTASQAEIAAGADPVQVFDAWVKKEIGQGSGDDIYDTAVLSDLGRKFESFQYQVTQDRAAMAKIKGIEALNTAVAAKVRDRDMTVDDLSTFIASMRSTFATFGDMESYQNAPKLLMNQIIGSYSMASGNKEDAEYIIGLLNAPGSGINGQSFAESFPDTADAAIAEINRDWMSGVNGKGLTAMNSLRDDLLNFDVGSYATSEDAMLAFQSLADKALTLRDQYGGYDDYDQFMTSLKATAKPLVEKMAGMDYINLALSGKMDDVVDSGVVKKYLPDTLKAAGASPLTNPVGAAQIINRLGVIDDDTKKTMSNALSSFDNPAALANAYTFYKTLAGQDRGETFALSMIDGEANKDIFLQIAGAEMTTNADLPTVVAQVMANREKAKGVKANINELYGDKGESAIRGKLREAIADQFDPSIFGGLNVTANSYVIDALYERTLQNYVSRGPGAQWDTVISDTVKAAGDRLSVIPGEGGVLTIDALGKNMKGLRFGEEVPIPGDALHRTINTVDVWNDDLADIHDKLPGVIEDTSTIGLVADESTGMYMVQESGIPVVLGFGQEYNIRTKTTRQVAGTGKVPAHTVEDYVQTPFRFSDGDFKDMIESSDSELAKLRDAIPAARDGRFVLVQHPMDPRGYRLYYVPASPEKPSTLKSVIEKQRVNQVGRTETLQRAQEFTDKFLNGELTGGLGIPVPTQ